jgi:2'-5' RNA ligase
MRTFIAIELPGEIKDALASLIEQLKKTQADVKWVAPGNIHLTLKFLGEIDEESVEKVIQILEESTKDKDRFVIKISSLGCFPNINSVRIIWIGIDKGDNETRKIANELEKNVAKIGIPEENRPFSSHITIGRTRSSLNREKLVGELQNLTNNSGLARLEFTVTKITLFKSTLTPKGPIYEVLKEASLKAI